MGANQLPFAFHRKDDNTMIIGFWQPIAGHGGSSVNCVSVASAMVLKYKLNCVVLQTHFSGNNLSHFLIGEGNQDDVYNNSGIDGLFRMFKTARSLIVSQKLRYTI